MIVDSYGNYYRKVTARTSGGTETTCAAYTIAAAINESEKLIASSSSAYNYGLTVSFPNVEIDKWKVVKGNKGRVRLHPAGAFNYNSLGPLLYTGDGSGLNENHSTSIFCINGNNLEGFIRVNEDSVFDLIICNDFILIYSNALKLLTFAGYLKDAKYPNDMRSLVLGHLGTIDNYVFRAAEVSHTSLRVNVQVRGEANYPIVCAYDAGAGIIPEEQFWSTDWVLKDTATNNICGRVPHILLAKGSGYVGGEIYYIDQVIDGITEVKTWKCLDFNFGTNKLLMRCPYV